MAVLCIVRYWGTSAASIKDYLAFDCNAGESQWLRIYLYLGDTLNRNEICNLFLSGIFLQVRYTLFTCHFLSFTQIVGEEN